MDNEIIKILNKYIPIDVINIINIYYNKPYHARTFCVMKKNKYKKNKYIKTGSFGFFSKCNFGL
jgi:hypothetical protein